jgi:hypothetical protein
MARCVKATVPVARALTGDLGLSYGRARPEGAREPTNGHDRITAHVVWTVPSGLRLPAALPARPDVGDTVEAT